MQPLHFYPGFPRSGISLAFWARSAFPSLAALFVLCSIEGQPLLPSARTGHQPSLYLCPCSLLTHALFVLCSIEGATVDSGTLPVPPLRRTRASLGSPSRSSHWFRVHSSIRCGSIPIAASLTANCARPSPRPSQHHRVAAAAPSASLHPGPSERAPPPCTSCRHTRATAANTPGTSSSTASSRSLSPRAPHRTGALRVATAAPPRRCTRAPLSALPLHPLQTLAPLPRTH